MNTQVCVKVGIFIGVRQRAENDSFFSVTWIPLGPPSQRTTTAAAAAAVSIKDVARLQKSPLVG